MKEQKEITFSKSDDFTKAVAYSKRLLKQKLYHSKTVQQKLENKYTPRVVAKTMKYLESHAYFDDELYINKLKKVCISKYYGVRRFKKILNEKGIYNKEHYYNFEEEREILIKFLQICKEKYKKLPFEEYMKKVDYLLRYKGFSSFNISKYSDY